MVFALDKPVMTMKRILNLIQGLVWWGVSALSTPAFAQDTTLQTQFSLPKAKYSRHALTVETLGKGGLYSLNYDYLASAKSAIGFGLSYQSIRAQPTISDAQVQLITLPVYANFYFPFQEHRPFVSTAVTFVKAHATANVDFSNIFSGIQLTYSANGSPEDKQELKVDKADMSFENSVDLLLAIPSLGAGYEFRTSEGAIFRLQALAFVYDKITPWAGLSFGVAL
jgi:hypothetical protein